MSHLKSVLYSRVDTHCSYTGNVEIIDAGRDKGVLVVCLVLYCTYKMHTLDVAFMQPVKMYCAQDVEAWLENHPHRVVAHYQIGDMLREEY
jgi:hypothetical protein